MIRLTDSSEYRIGIDKLAYYNPTELHVRRTMEECGELIQAVNKMYRTAINEECDGDAPDAARKSLIEEMADVMICIDIIRSVYNIDDTEVDEAVKIKMRRNLHRLNLNRANKRVSAYGKAFAVAHECCRR